MDKQKKAKKPRNAWTSKTTQKTNLHSFFPPSTPHKTDKDSSTMTSRTVFQPQTTQAQDPSVSTRKREEDEDQMMSSPLPPPKRQAAISATVTSGALQLLHGQAASPLGALPVEESLEAEEITPHPKWGQLSVHPHQQQPRVDLLEFYESVRLNVRLRDDIRLSILKKEAEWGVNEAGPKFTPTKLNKRGAPTIGYYFDEGGRRCNAASYSAQHMKVNVLHPPKYKPDFADRNKASQQAQRDKAPDLEVVYIGAVSDYSVQEIREKYVWSPAMGPIPVDGRSAGAVFYAGMHQGHQLGYLGIREDHTRDKTSLLYQNSIGAAANPKNMLQIMYRMCDSRDTKELVEAFIMRYQYKSNNKYGIQEHFITKVRSLKQYPGLQSKADQYAADGIPLIAIDSNWDRSQQSKYWTLDELTTLPLKVGPSEVVKIWDATTRSQVYKFPRVKNAAELLQQFPNPPDSFFKGKPKLEAECRAVQN
ncbi:hypothetical protein Fcan01_02208 [Folsomia candida]|uniref:Uncharacterized protein n=1 Tax=Folsomia candida TaxID=158441 RepID=A0A226F5L7_FOLCA|nr:hypothetical protein Fcan01_02208 [Folsomia candida]